MSYILEAEGLEYSYHAAGRKALDGADLRVGEGEFVALLGANGCGKTTLLRHLNGLLRPQAGEVRLQGRPLSSYRQEEVFQTVGLVFQDPDDQLFAPSVLEDVSYAPTNMRLPRAEVLARAREALELMEMWEYRDESIHHLSYGQKKRVAIAGILAMRPRVMLLDEPTAGLDPRTASRLLRLLQELRRRSGLTIVMSTHDVDLVPVYCDRVYVLENGRACVAGAPGEVFGTPGLIRGAALRLPRVAHLLEILRQRDGLPVQVALTIGAARRELAAVWRQREGQG